MKENRGREFHFPRRQRQRLYLRVFGGVDDVRPSEVINEGAGPPRDAIYEGGRGIHPCRRHRQRHFDWNTVDWPNGPMALSADLLLSLSNSLATRVLLTEGQLHFYVKCLPLGSITMFKLFRLIFEWFGWVTK